MLVKIFEEQVERYANKTLVSFNQTQLTYQQVNIAANKIAQQILTLGDSISNIALLFEHGPDMIIGVIGALKAGKVYIPMDPTYPEKRLLYMLEDGEVSVVLTNEQNLQYSKLLAEQMPRKIQVVNIDQLSQSITTVNPSLQITGDQGAYILYTSGSTGQPKGVVQNHANIWHFVKNYIESFQITPDDHLTLFSAFGHDAAVMDIFSGILSGATLHPLNLKRLTNLADLSSWLREKRITIYHSVPTVYRYFVRSLNESISEDFSDLRYVILGGESVLEHDIVQFKKLFPHQTVLVNLYGQSESSFNSAQYIRADTPLEKINLGEVVEDTEIWVVNEDGEEVDELETGEIVIISDHVALGYWNDQEKTERVFGFNPAIGRIYHTGDMGRLTLDGKIEFVGRRDFQIKIRGFRVDLSEIESHLLNHPDIYEAVVLARNDTTGNTYLCAYIVAQEQLAETIIKDYLKTLVPDYMIPTYYMRLEKLPLTATNKIDRKALPAPERGRTGVDYVAPRNDTERRLTEIWSVILQIDADNIGVRDSFFDLGGNSLSIMQLVSIINREFEQELTIPNLFDATTIELLAQRIVGKRPATEERKIARFTM